ncbi:MAG: GNAT family N-acetyltransferase [Anaerolineales bacterium]|nr:GNAT family N-acetyltransferase [Anaerolineales bacterium]
MKAQTFPLVQQAIEIVPANWRDTFALHQLEKICFPLDSWPLFDIIAALTFPNMVRLKAVQNTHIVGFVLGDYRPSEDLAWIASLAVHPDYRNRGIGGDLLRQCEAQLNVSQVRLSVRMSNGAAIKLYKNSGYHVTGNWPKYYKGGEDALVMEKQLP